MEFEVTFPCPGKGLGCESTLSIVVNAMNPAAATVQCAECGTTLGLEMRMGPRMGIDVVRVDVANDAQLRLVADC